MPVPSNAKDSAHPLSKKMVDNKIVSELENYLKIVSTSIGVRQQNKLPRELALYLADCRASHKNLTLFF